MRIVLRELLNCTADRALPDTKLYLNLRTEIWLRIALLGTSVRLLISNPVRGSVCF